VRTLPHDGSHIQKSRGRVQRQGKSFSSHVSSTIGVSRNVKPFAHVHFRQAVFVKIDTNKQHELSSRYQVRSLPTFSYFLNGRKVDGAVGGIGEAALRQQVQKLVRDAELENTKLELSALIEYYKAHDASKSESDVQNVHQKCVGMNSKGGATDCVGAAANQLSRKLKKKYGEAPKLVQRFDPAAAATEEPTAQKPKTKSNSSSNKDTPNLNLASLEELQQEIERRLDEKSDQADEEGQESEDYSTTNIWDGPSVFPERLIIVGAGPAGLAAAIYGARAGLAPLVIAPSMGGQLQGKGVDVENYPGMFDLTSGNDPKLTTGPAIVAAMRAQAEHFGAIFLDDTVRAVVAVDRDSTVDMFKHGMKPKPLSVVTNSSGTIETHSLIVATGADANWLGVKGEWELRGGGVSSCAVCDGFLYSGKDVLVVGGGDAAMEDALVLARTSKSVTVIHRRGHFRASKVLADRVLNHPLITVKWNMTMQEILSKEAPRPDQEAETVDMDEPADKIVSGAILKDTASGEATKVVCDAVFVAIGHKPNTSFLKGVVEFNAHHPGYVEVFAGTTHTSAMGIFAAGDVSDAVYRQAITSAGTGAAAALDAERYLSEHGLGNEEAEMEAALLADLMGDLSTVDSSAYNAYEEAGRKIRMKESLGNEL
jgi:thioredoxin reductase (NADPH)